MRRLTTTALSNLTFTLFESCLVDRPNMNYITHFLWSVFYICINKLYPKCVVYQPQADGSVLHLQPVSEPKQRRLIFRSNGFCLRRFSSTEAIKVRQGERVHFSVLCFDTYSTKFERFGKFTCTKNPNCFVGKCYDTFLVPTFPEWQNPQTFPVFSK